MKRATCLLAALALVAALPSSAAAARRHSVNGTVMTTALTQTGNPPISGSSTDTGVVHVALGSGAFVGTTTYAAPNFTAKFTVFFAHGVLRGTFAGTGTVQHGGDVTFSGSGKITGGTDRYKGAKGKFTFTGSAPKNNPVSTFQVTGFAKY